MAFDGANPNLVKRQTWRVGGFESLTISATTTLTDASAQYLSIDGGAADRTVKVPDADVTKAGQYFIFYNRGTTNSLLLTDVTGNAIGTVTHGSTMRIGVNTSGAWAVFSSSTVAAAPAGTVAAPGLAFDSDTDTGWYSQAADVIGLALGGVASVAIGATAPTIAAATDTAGQDTVIRAPSAGGTATAARLGGAYDVKAGTGSAGTTTVIGGAGGPGKFFAGNGGAKSSGTTNGAGAGGAWTGGGGDGGASASTTTGAGGNGGAATLSGGAGGAQTAGTTAAGGDGGNAGLTAGVGGAASSGTGNGGNGGSIPLTPGEGGTSSGGTAGIPGCVFVKGTAPHAFLTNQAVAQLADASVTLTDAQHRGGIVTVAAGANNRTITTRTAAQLVAAFPGIQVGSTLPLTISNLKAANTVTVGLGSGVTMDTGGNAVVAAQAAATFLMVFTNVTASSEAVNLVRAAG